MKYLDKILVVATKIKTPLSIASISIIVLYLVVKQILSMNIFSNIGDTKTYLVIDNILNKMFLLSVISLSLGIATYILTYIYKNKSYSKESNIKLIDARNDDEMSNYKQTDNNHIKITTSNKKHD